MFILSSAVCCIVIVQPSSEGPQPLTVSALQKHDHVELDSLHRKIDFKTITAENRFIYNALLSYYKRLHLSHLISVGFFVIPNTIYKEVITPVE